MTEKLTDAELISIHNRPGTSTLDCLRAVQDAVLAKAEVETRERERMAYAHGHSDNSWGKVNVDTRYPSLRRPASVTLSTGTWTKVDDLWDGVGNDGCIFKRFHSPRMDTLDDYRKMVSYLEAQERK